MEERRTDRLTEQYEDAALALLMGLHAEEDGRRFLDEVEALERDGPLPGYSQELYDAGEQFLKNYCAAACKMRKRNRIKKVVGHVAACVMICLGLISVTLVSVDAFRTSKLKFGLVHHDVYTSVVVEGWALEEIPFLPTIGEIEVAEGTTAEGPLAGLLPEDYELFDHEVNESTFSTVYFTADNTSMVLFRCINVDSTINIDTENAERIEETMILDCPAVFVKESDCLHMLWIDSACGQIYDLIVTGIEETGFFELAEAIVERFSGE